nr:reverse transcriptase domain-containing protein [Tanacetum cinerariifolium]
MIQQVQNSYHFYGLPGDDANKHIDKFLHVTQSIKVNGVTDDALRLYLFPHSLTHHATTWFDRLPRNSINTFEQMAKMFLGQYFSPSMVTKLRNEITNFRQRPDESLFEAWERYKLSIDRSQRSESSSSITSSFDSKIVALKAKMVEINKNLMKVLQINQQVKAITLNCETCGGPHSYNDCPPIVGQTQNVCDVGAFQGGTLPSNTITNPKEDLKGITTQSGTAYQGPTIPTTSSSSPPVVERETEVTKDTLPHTNNESTKDVQPPVIQIETSNSKPVVAPAVELVFAPVIAPKPNQKPSIPYPSRLHDQKLRDKANDQKEKLFQIFKDLDFNISFVDALILMPKFGPTIKNVYVKVGKFHFPADFDANPRVPLILERSFLKTKKDLIDVYEGELTLRIRNEAVTFNLDQTSRYSANYNDMTENQIDVIDMACEEYSQEVLGFSNVIASGNPTPYYNPIISTSSSTLTPLGDSDFLLEEV